MKQDKFEQIVKESLESINPEVPGHLWDNIRTQIPTTPANQATGVEQGGAASAGSVTGGLLKLGAAAVALIGVGALIWYVNTNDQEIAQKDNEEVAQKIQQKDRVVEEPSDTYRADRAPLEHDAEAASGSENKESLDGGHSKPVSAAPAQEEEVNPAGHEDSQEAGDEPNSAGNEVLRVNSGDNNGADDNVLGEKSGNEAVAKKLNPAQDREASQDAQPEDYNLDDSDTEPVILVECGILANKVSGESPLSVQFSNVTKARSFEWDFGNGRKSYDAEPMTTFDEAGDYNVLLTVTDFEGNRLTDQMEISVFEPSTFFAPNAFSPNGDGLNDYFTVEGTNISNVNFEIFRLDGSLVYEGTSIHDKWDGTDSQQSGDSQYLVVTKFIRNDGTPDIDKTMLSVIRE